MTDLVWFRTDLRITDQPALAAARDSGPAIGLFIVSPQQWRSHPEAPSKQELWRRLLKDLRPRLSERGVALKLLRVENWQDVPQALLAFCQKHDITRVHCNREQGVYERRRDRAAYKLLAQHGIELIGYDGQTLMAPGSLKTGSGATYRVFSPFARACRAQIARVPLELAYTPGYAPLPAGVDPDDIDLVWPERLPCLAEHWPADLDEIERRLVLFVRERASRYDTARDFPSEPGTSQLSPYLAAGAISVKQCFYQALQHNHGELESGNPGIRSWMNELIWREFYWHLLHGFPKLSMHRPLREETDAVVWRDAPEDVAAWCKGRTGVPIVDAAMHQLVATGWMHNRLRMIVAMFLTKNLLIDWRVGERFFMEHLIDGELAANNGGWQWSASTGADAAPYFRVFNPVSQSEKFDPDGRFIRHWLPQLAALDKKSIHNPSQAQREALGYPSMLVDLKSSRQRAIDAFKGI
ncbi:MAG: deoxyribodipyrimidine photo-lyase [Burkholderiaceae bacterium]|nr:deoxyribodipyrimidine photo-lyase [Burkholderiaceae bacterium]